MTVKTSNNFVVYNIPGVYVSLTEKIFILFKIANVQSKIRHKGFTIKIHIKLDINTSNRHGKVSPQVQQVNEEFGMLISKRVWKHV